MNEVLERTMKSGVSEYDEYWNFYLIEKASKTFENDTGSKWSINCGFSDLHDAKQFAKKIHSHRKKRIVTLEELRTLNAHPEYTAFWKWDRRDEDGRLYH